MFQSAARLCWKIGPYKYREVEVYDEKTLNSDVLGISGFTRVRDSHDALIAGTEVHGMTPSDYNIDVSTNVLLGKLPLPMFESGSKFRVTVIGARFGDSVAESPLVIRPVAMPFAMDDSASIFCARLMRGLSDGDDMRSSRFDFCKSLTVPYIVRVAIAQRQVCNCGIQGVMVWSRCIYLVEGRSQVVSRLFRSFVTTKRRPSRNRAKVLRSGPSLYAG